MLRGQASLQDIIGRTQSFRKPARSTRRGRRSKSAESNSAEDGIQKSDAPAFTPSTRKKKAPAQDTKPRAADAGPPEGSEQLHSPFEDQQGIEAQPTPSSPLRRSPRKAAATHKSKSEDLTSSHHCPVCSRALPHDSEEINRHLGMP